MATIVAHNSNITEAGPGALLYTATTGGTINIRILNAGQSRTDVLVSMTATPESPGQADLVDMAKLNAGQALLLTGEPVKAGESVVVSASGTSINLACRVSGFMGA